MVDAQENDSLFPKIDASPTKEFFISMLARDVKLPAAINDLIDNCVDGARRMRADGIYTGLSIDIELSEKSFTIIDNCGGIPYEIARDYAFRFGRPEGAPTTEGSIGKFGVGMKRALFKIGKKFSIESTSEKSKFKILIDVEQWKRQQDENGKEKWEFEFSELNQSQQNDSSTWGTILSVEDLHPSISDEFKLTSFVNRLADSLQSAHEQPMEQGLEISINNFQLKHKLATLLESDSIKPLKITKSFEIGATVTATIYAGISDINLAESGWYVICNGRQILKADKSRTTGWEDKESIPDIETPKSHHQFARFRGYVFFESSDASLLPWNTSKSGVDEESRVYQSTRIEMIAAMRQVIDFLNKIDAEKESESTFYQDHLNKTVPAKISSIKTIGAFKYPVAETTVTPPKLVRVSFTRPPEDIDFAKEFFKVSTAKSAGEASFDYFLSMEKD